MNKKISGLVRLAKEYAKYGDIYLCGISAFCEVKPRVHLLEEGFISLFGNGEKVVSRDIEGLPWEHSAEVDDVVFFCISNKEDLNEKKI